jgi:hypothetical protein
MSLLIHNELTEATEEDILSWVRVRLIISIKVSMVSDGLLLMNPNWSLINIDDVSLNQCHGVLQCVCDG